LNFFFASAVIGGIACRRAAADVAVELAFGTDTFRGLSGKPVISRDLTGGMAADVEGGALPGGNTLS
jgi:hypothetical protein